MITLVGLIHREYKLSDSYTLHAGVRSVFHVIILGGEFRAYNAALSKYENISLLGRILRAARIHIERACASNEAKVKI